MNNYNIRLRTKNEATGMRIVSQFVQEFWECGWQPFDQRNDNGIDGLIIIRKKGIDLGAKINIQVKCGPSYISSQDDKEIRISIDDIEGLKKHIEYWRKQVEPAVLVFVNPSKPLRDQHGNIKFSNNHKPIWIESRNKAKAWWINLKNTEIQVKGTGTIIKIDKKNTFGEHSKGDFLKLVAPLIGDNTLQVIELDEIGRSIYFSENLRKTVKEFYCNWKKENESLWHCKSLNKDLIISRTGWLHITKSRRGKERRIVSLKLLGAAKQIISEADNYLLLNQRETDLFLEQKLGLLVKLRIRNEGDKIVQVIIVKRKYKLITQTKYWFYSIHHRR